MPDPSLLNESFDAGANALPSLPDDVVLSSAYRFIPLSAFMHTLVSSGVRA